MAVTLCILAWSRHSIAEIAIDKLSPAFSVVRDKVNELRLSAGGVFDRMPQWAQDIIKVTGASWALSKAIGGVGSMIPIIGGPISMIGGMLNPLKLLTGPLQAIRGLITAIGGGLSALLPVLRLVIGTFSPWSIVIRLIAVGFVALYKGNETFREGIKYLGESIWSFAKGAGASLIESLKSIYEWGRDSVVPMLKGEQRLQWGCVQRRRRHGCVQFNGRGDDRSGPEDRPADW